MTMKEIPILATEDQRVVEERAVAVMATGEMRDQIERTRDLYLADPNADLAGGRATLDKAVAELACAAALVGVNSDPLNPRVGWVYSAPRRWQGREVPGSRWGVDNPDNVYRIVPVDGVSRFELRVRQLGQGPVQSSFLIYNHFVGEDGHHGDVDKPQGGLRGEELVWSDGDSLLLTLDPDPPGGRPNHIQTRADSKQLLIRNSLSDWTRQLPLAIAVERLGAASGSGLDDVELARRSASFLESLTGLSLAWKRNALFGHWNTNVLSEPYGRGMKWGFAASGNFDLADDEALVVTVDPLDAEYLGFSATDPWLASLDHVDRQSSLNKQQAVANGDGTYTYVVAGTDPGFHNWIDTCGLPQGSMLYRWQLLPDTRTDAAGAVKDVCVVKLGRLREHLPHDAAFITAVERAEMLAERERSYELRYAAGE